MRRLVLLMVLASVRFAPALAAETADPSDDVRDLRIGKPVALLNMANYQNLQCQGVGPHAGQTVNSLGDYSTCDPDSRGHVQIGLEYAPDRALASMNDRFEGTKLGGHPVTVAVGVDARGRIQSIDIKSDPRTSRYLKKKAFLLSARVKARYGTDGWNCSQERPGGARASVGGMFIEETCQKQLAGRLLTLKTNLYRLDALSSFEVINETQLLIEARPDSPS